MVLARPRHGRRRRAAGLLTAVLVGAAVPTALIAGPARPAAAEDLASAVLRALPLEQQVGQVFMVGAPATGAGAATVAAIRDRHVGNVILTGRSSLGVSGTASVTAALQAQTTASATGGVRLLVGTDQEGGQVQVLKGT